MNKNDSTNTNHSPPMHCLCQPCKGKGKIWKDDWWEGQEGDAIVLPCVNCSETGLNPLPLPEVISGLRRGNIVRKQAKVWNQWPKEEM